ncbi:MAG: hypothetical protein NXI31_26785, partial [bacterium]|nr:hypothetical protein [bacterium]
MHRFVYAAAVVSLTAAVTAQSPAASADESRELRVLFVGHDPEAPKVAFRQLAKPRTFQLYRERTAAFEALLRYHFENVTVVHGEDYLASMSDDYDVTVFDTRPKPIRPLQRKPVYRQAK